MLGLSCCCCWFVVVVVVVDDDDDDRFYYNSKYGSYLTKPNQEECLILRRSASISPIQTIGDPQEGELKLFYSPNIILDEE